ncbi:MAG: class I tRNA ligase family protein, partial [Microbacterium gubbeenense]|uniref:class I tRNA ligase family protein n=1 Tax=Microbacterium gubbeenense TaxID=159896 RepID=UPI003F9DEB33
AFDPQNPTQIKIGRRLAIKVLNAAKFALGFDAPEGSEVTEPLDLAMLAALDRVIDQATASLDAYDHARALEVSESFFWTFCDDYLELVKERAYEGGPAGASAAVALRTALSTLLRLLAPVISFATEEAWSWFQDGSVHTAPWPVSSGAAGDPAVLEIASQALIGVRRAKTEAKASQRTPVASATITAPGSQLALLQLAAADLKAVGRIEELTIVEGAELEITEIELAPAEG